VHKSAIVGIPHCLTGHQRW